MKKCKWKLIFSLLICVVAVLINGLLFPVTPTKPLSFVGATVAPIPIAQRNRNNPYSPDTSVEVTIKVARGFFNRHLFPIKNAMKVRVGNAHLTDKNGTKYFWTAPAGNLAPRSKINAGSTSIVNGDVMTYFYQLNLSQYPKAVGPLTFHATYAMGDDFRLPVTVVVRN